jgi:hypothetical protein
MAVQAASIVLPTPPFALKNAMVFTVLCLSVGRCCFYSSLDLLIKLLVI